MSIYLYIYIYDISFLIHSFIYKYLFPSSVAELHDDDDDGDEGQRSVPLSRSSDSSHPFYDVARHGIIQVSGQFGSYRSQVSLDHTGLRSVWIIQVSDQFGSYRSSS